jgi:hypothetical protein
MVTGTTAVVDPALGPVSELELSGVTPATTHYDVAGGAQGGFSAEHSFSRGRW